MKCEFCLGNISLKDKRCPHCGQPPKYSDIVVKIIALAALIIVFVSAWIANSRADDIYYAVTEFINKANFKEHRAELDKYLEDEDYIGLYDYCDRNEIIGSDAGFEDYECIINLCWCYGDVYEELMVRVCDSEKNEERSFSVEILGSALNRFYAYQDAKYYQLSEEGKAQTDAFKEQINQNLEKLLMVYCNVPADKVDSLGSMSEAERTAFIGECVANEK